MKGIMCKTIEKDERKYKGVAMLLPIVTRNRPHAELDRGVELIVIAPNKKALDYAKKLLQGDIYEPLEDGKCKSVYVSEAA